MIRKEPTYFTDNRNRHIIQQRKYLTHQPTHTFFIVGIIAGHVKDIVMYRSITRQGWNRNGNRHQLDLIIRSEEHTSELQSRENLVCRLLLEKKKKQKR